MPQFIEGELLANGLKIAIAAARFNEFITERLVDGAVDTFRRHGGDPGANDSSGDLTIARVPGSFELPVTAMKLAKTGRFDAVVCLGCVIRGQTDHYDHVAAQAASGIAAVPVQTGVATIFGVITADSVEQAIERAGSKQGNHGAKAMVAAIEMANLLRKI